MLERTLRFTRAFTEPPDPLPPCSTACWPAYPTRAPPPLLCPPTLPSTSPSAFLAPSAEPSFDYRTVRKCAVSSELGFGTACNRQRHCQISVSKRLAIPAPIWTYRRCGAVLVPGFGSAGTPHRRQIYCLLAELCHLSDCLSPEFDPSDFCLEILDPLAPWTLDFNRFWNRALHFMIFGISRIPKTSLVFQDFNVARQHCDSLGLWTRRVPSSHAVGG